MQEKKNIGEKNLQTVCISLKLEPIYSNNSQQYYFESLVFFMFSYVGMQMQEVVKNVSLCIFLWDTIKQAFESDF